MLAATLLMKKRVADSMKSERETTGTLVGFYIMQTGNGAAKAPQILFIDGERKIKAHTFRPNSWLTDEDIGKEFTISYRQRKQGNATDYIIHLTDEVSQRERSVYNAQIFWGMVAMAAFFFGMAVLFSL